MSKLSLTNNSLIFNLQELKKMPFQQIEINLLYSIRGDPTFKKQPFFFSCFLNDIKLLNSFVDEIYNINIPEINW